MDCAPHIIIFCVKIQLPILFVVPASQNTTIFALKILEKNFQGSLEFCFGSLVYNVRTNVHADFGYYRNKLAMDMVMNLVIWL